MLADFQVTADAVGTNVKRFTTIAETVYGVSGEPRNVLKEITGIEIAEMADFGG